MSPLWKNLEPAATHVLKLSHLEAWLIVILIKKSVLCNLSLPDHHQRDKDLRAASVNLGDLMRPSLFEIIYKCAK